MWCCLRWIGASRQRSKLGGRLGKKRRKEKGRWVQGGRDRGKRERQRGRETQIEKERQTDRRRDRQTDIEGTGSRIHVAVCECVNV